MNITKNTKHGGRRAQWQEVIFEPDCKRCLAIIENRNKKQNKV